MLAWIVIVPAAILAVLCAVQAVSAGGGEDYHRARESVIAAAIAGGAGLCAAGFAGVLPPMAVLILATAAALTAVGGLWYEQGTRNGEAARLGAILGDVATAARAAVRSVFQLARTRQDRGEGQAGPAVIPGEAEDVTPRMVPPVRLDPALDEPAAGETAVTPGHVPPQWGALASFIAGFEPEDDAAELGFLRDTSAGILAVADAFRAHAENCGEGGAGLDSAFVQAVLEAGDSVGDCAHDVALARRRFLVVYQEVLEAVRAGLRLPHKARQFLTGETGEAA